MTTLFQQAQQIAEGITAEFDDDELTKGGAEFPRLTLARAYLSLVEGLQEIASIADDYPDFAATRSILTLAQGYLERHP